MSKKIITPRSIPRSTILHQCSTKLKSILASHGPNHLPILPKNVSTQFPSELLSVDKKASILVPIIDYGNNNTNVNVNTNVNTNVSTNANNSKCILDRIAILFTKRSNHLKQHANEISFPGGHFEPLVDGNSLIQTAIRETKEELLMPDFHVQQCASTSTNANANANTNTSMTHTHLDPDPRYDFDHNLVVLGQVETIPSAKLVPVTPFLAYFKHQIPPDIDRTSTSTNKSTSTSNYNNDSDDNDNDDNDNNDNKKTVSQLFPGNENEVSQVFTVSINELLAVEDKMPLKRLGMEGPVYKTKYGVIWGLTALVLKPILDDVLKPVLLSYQDHNGVVNDDGIDIDDIDDDDIDDDDIDVDDIDVDIDDDDINDVDYINDNIIDHDKGRNHS